MLRYPTYRIEKDPRQHEPVVAHMNLRDLHYVVAVAEHRNFTRAAEAAAVSQPALSNQIKKLEAEFGSPIFQREHGGVHLTAFGRDLVSNAKQVIELVDKISDIARQYRTSEKQPLRLGMTPTLAAYLSLYLRELFVPITGDRKIVIVEDYPVALSKMVTDRSVDMAFIARKSFDKIYEDAKRPHVFTSLWLEPLFLAVRTNHPLTQNSSIWAHQVPEDQLIRFSISFGYGLEEDLPTPSDAAVESTGIDVKSARFETVCRYVAQSDACTIVNAIAAEQFKRDGFGLSFIPFNDEGNMRELGVSTRPGFPHPEIITALQEGVRRNAPAGTIASGNKAIAGTPITTIS